MHEQDSGLLGGSRPTKEAPRLHHPATSVHGFNLETPTGRNDVLCV